MGNIILQDGLKVTTTKLSVEDENDLGSLKFYISKKYNLFSVCVAIIDSYGVFDIIPLAFLSDETNYKVYCINCKNATRIKNGKCKMIFFIFDKELQYCRSSESIDIGISTTNYTLLHKTYISKQISDDIASYYDKIVKLTEMNIELYDKITKREEVL